MLRSPLPARPALPALVAYIDAAQRYRFCNPSHNDIAGTDASQLVGLTVCEVLGSSGYAVLAPELAKALQGSAVAFERMLHIGQHYIDALVEFVPDLDPVAGVRGVYVVIIDQSARRAAEQALLQQQALLHATLASVGEPLLTTDAQGQIAYMNASASALCGWQLEQCLGWASGAVVPLYERAGCTLLPDAAPRVLAQPGVPVSYRDVLLRTRSGAYIPVEGSVTAILSDGVASGTVWILRDVSAACALAAELTYQASHDALTGLLNRREFEQRLEALIVATRGTAVRHTMLYMDLDQFKIVNDTCGHAAGDELLRQLSRVLRGTLRHTDLLARLGGDEFGVLLHHCSGSDAAITAESLRRTIYDFNFIWRDRMFPIGVSIGLISFGDDGLQLADLLRRADAACYLAKDKGRNQFRVFDADDQELLQRQGQIDWASRIHCALNDNRFVLYQQKIQALSGAAGSVPHYEVLLRMRDEDGSVIPPMAFVPAAERYGLMPLIDRWVIRRAFLEIAGRNPAGQAPRELCAINLSGASVGDPSMLAYICEQFDACALEPSAVCFEITETAAISNLSDAIRLIEALAVLGCRFALDDFGSGMSSFAYLKHLPVNFLKIDGEFVKDILERPVDHAMVEAINRIGHVMEIETIAEYVETDAIRERLAALKIDYVQGYGVHRPEPMAELLQPVGASARNTDPLFI